MKHAQAQERAPDRVQPRTRETNAENSAAPKSRVKAERKPAARDDAAPDAVGTKLPPTGKKLPPAADSDATKEAASHARGSDAPPMNAPPVPVAALVLQPMPVTDSAAPTGSAATQAPVSASTATSATSATPATPAPIAASLPHAPEKTNGSGLPDVVPDAAQKPAENPKTAASPIPTPPPAAHSAAFGTDAIPQPPVAADSVLGAVASAQAAAVTTPADPATSGKPKFGVAMGANPGSTGTAANSAADVASSSAAQALISNPVPALNASAPGADRDAASRGAVLVQTAAAAGLDAASLAASAPVTTPAAKSAGAADPAVFKLHQGLDSPDFPQALADKVAWLVDKDIGSAKLQINPPQLGPIDVRIEVQGDKAQVWLSAHSVVTREALEASSPKLREMLGSQGFAQVSVDVSQRSFQDRSSPAAQTQWLPTTARTHPDELFSAPAAPLRRMGPGALDAYA